MRILIFLSHPAQFLFYKNTVSELKAKGHKVFLLIKTKDILAELLDESGLEYYNIIPKARGNSKLSILLNLFKRDWKLFNFVRKRKIDILMGSDASLAHVGKLLNIPCITTLEDDYDVIKVLAKFTYPFTTTILAPEVCDVGKWQHKKISYQGYMKLAYLHPSQFVPDRNRVMIDASQPYFLLRLSGLSAHHDFGIKGLSDALLKEVITKLEQKGRVLISSEKILSPEYEQYRLKIPLSDIHHYLYYAQMLICDSQSMAVEAAVLGTPGIRISSFSGKISVLEELEHTYHLTYGFDPANENGILSRLEELLNSTDLKQRYQANRQKMLAEKINVTPFLVWFIENYPKSVKTVREDFDYQERFN